MSKRWMIAAGAGAVVVVGVAATMAWQAAHRKPPKSMVYTSSGYGGYVPASQPGAKPSAPPEPVQPAKDAYNAGHYRDAERKAEAVIAQAARNHSLPMRKQAADARYVMAFSAARRKDLKLARARFAAVKQEAAALPDKGKPKPEVGQNPPTLEEEAAYQHAVCTAALGDKAGAEAEYKQFMRDFPESPLVHGAVQRIGRLHGGNIPKDAEAVWRQAMQVAQKRDKARMREASLCAPECLAELLHRRGAAEDVHALANEMGTTDHGTTLEALSRAAASRGYKPKGLALTYKGLRKQKLPVIALLAPGHFVIVDAASEKAVTIWDPDASREHRPNPRSCELPEWNRLWRGVALTLQ